MYIFEGMAALTCGCVCLVNDGRQRVLQRGGGAGRCRGVTATGDRTPPPSRTPTLSLRLSCLPLPAWIQGHLIQLTDDILPGKSPADLG